MERVCLVNGRILVLEVSEGLKDWYVRICGQRFRVGVAVFVMRIFVYFHCSVQFSLFLLDLAENCVI